MPNPCLISGTFFSSFSSPHFSSSSLLLFCIRRGSCRLHPPHPISSSIHPSSTFRWIPLIANDHRPLDIIRSLGRREWIRFRSAFLISFSSFLHFSLFTSLSSHSILFIFSFSSFRLPSFHPIGHLNSIHFNSIHSIPSTLLTGFPPLAPFSLVSFNSIRSDISPILNHSGSRSTRSTTGLLSPFPWKPKKKNLSGLHRPWHRDAPNACGMSFVFFLGFLGPSPPA